MAPPPTSRALRLRVPTPIRGLVATYFQPRVPSFVVVGVYRRQGGSGTPSLCVPPCVSSATRVYPASRPCVDPHRVEARRRHPKGNTHDDTDTMPIGSGGSNKSQRRSNKKKKKKEDDDDDDEARWRKRIRWKEDAAKVKHAGQIGKKKQASVRCSARRASCLSWRCGSYSSRFYFALYVCSTTIYSSLYTITSPLYIYTHDATFCVATRQTRRPSPPTTPAFPSRSSGGRRGRAAPPSSRRTR